MSTLISAFLKAKDFCISTDEKTGKSYIEPLWEQMLKDSGILSSDAELDQWYDKISKNEKTEDIVTAYDLYPMLELEVEKRNAQNDAVSILCGKINQLFDEKIDPYLEKENNELLLHLIEYMQTKEAFQGETSTDPRKQVKQIAGGMVNFAKK